MSTIMMTLSVPVVKSKLRCGPRSGSKYLGLTASGIQRQSSSALTPPLATVVETTTTTIATRGAPWCSVDPQKGPGQFAIFGTRRRARNSLIAARCTQRCHHLEAKVERWSGCHLGRSFIASRAPRVRCFDEHASAQARGHEPKERAKNLMHGKEFW